mgnify:CR=1 FL=1
MEFEQFGELSDISIPKDFVTGNSRGFGFIEFAKKENAVHEIKNVVSQQKSKYAAELLIKTFTWKKITEELEVFCTETESKKFNGKVLAFATANNMLNKAKAQQEVSIKFIAELDKRFAENPVNQTWLNEKVPSAKKYFAAKIKEELIIPLNALQAELKGKTKVRKYSKQVNELEGILWKKINDIQRVTFGDLTFEVEKIERKTETLPEKKSKVEKGASKFESLAFYKQGMKIPEIAKQRDMAITLSLIHI